MIQWDATSLITCAKFELDGRLVLDFALDAGAVLVSEEVKQETVDAGLARGFPDAIEIERRLASGQIEVRTASRLPDPFEDVLDQYGLAEGDKSLVRTAEDADDVETTVTDDRLLYLVLRRCGHDVLLLPDFVERAVTEGAFDSDTGQRLLRAVRPRLANGFVEHSLRRLEGVI